MSQAFSALRYRDFTVYAAARFCNSLAWAMLGVAVGWQVYQLTHNPLYLGFVGLAQFLPFVLLVLPAGYVADHADRRLLLVGAYSVQGVCADLLGGLHFVLHRPTVLGAISLDLFAVLFGGATALLPAFASDILHIGPAGLGVLRAAPGVGAALTSLAVGLAPIERNVGP
jgi:MFS family permease